MNMSPRLAMNDFIDGLRFNSVTSSNLRLRFALSKCGKHLSDILFGKFADTVRFTSGLAILFRLIFHVVALRPKKQMARIYTRWIVAAMQHKDSFRNRGDEHLIACHVGVNIPALACAELPVPKRRLCGLPFPASIGRILNLFKKSPSSQHRTKILPATMRGFTFYKVHTVGNSFHSTVATASPKRGTMTVNTMQFDNLKEIVSVSGNVSNGHRRSIADSITSIVRKFAMVFFPLAALGQVSNPSIILVSVAPSGACSAGLPNQQVITTGIQYSCQGGTWGAFAASSGGGGTPGSPVGSVQTNQGGAFVGDANFVWDNTAKQLTVGPAESTLDPLLQGWWSQESSLVTSSGNFSGLGVEAQATSGIAYGFGAIALAQATAGNFTSYAIGLEGIGLTDSGTHNVGGILGGQFFVEHNGSGTLTNAIGARVDSTSNLGGGIITNNQGLLIQDQTVGAFNWAIKTGLGLVELGDQVKMPNITGHGTAGVVHSDTSGNLSQSLVVAADAPTLAVAPVNGAVTSATGGSGTSTVTCLTASCTNISGTYSVVGGTFTTGNLLVLVWPTTTAVYKCSVSQNGGVATYGIGHSVATATGMTITSGISVLGITVTFDYKCSEY